MVAAVGVLLYRGIGVSVGALRSCHADCCVGMLINRYRVSFDQGETWLTGTLNELAAQSYRSREGVFCRINNLRGTEWLQTLQPYVQCRYLQLTPRGSWWKGELVLCGRNLKNYTRRTAVPHVASENRAELIGTAVHKGLLPEIRVRYRGSTADSFLTYRDACEDRHGFELVNALTGAGSGLFTKAEYTGNLIGTETVYQIDGGGRWYANWGVMMRRCCQPRQVKQYARSTKTARVSICGESGKVVAWLD